MKSYLVEFKKSHDIANVNDTTDAEEECEVCMAHQGNGFDSFKECLFNSICLKGEWFDSFKECDGASSTFVNGGELKSEGVGNVKIKWHDGKVKTFWRCKVCFYICKEFNFFGKLVM